ncbi:MAG TPA: hypothetical protein VFZ25_07735 [Chloroflexota bacterium]|nr:hypothetical protein [Chloroflexota bacterium]
MATLKLWMDVMRRLEPVIADYARLFDAWEAGGVDGLALGPMVFEGNIPTFDPAPEIYRAFGIEPPPPPREPLPEKRALLERAIRAAQDRGWQVWIFQPGIGAPPAPAGSGSLMVDADSRRRWSARILDTMSHYPMADGAVLDGPEWGYEIHPGHMVTAHGPRSYIFDDLPASAAATCAALGYDYAALVAAKDRLFARLHALTDREVRRHGGRAGGLLGGFGLFGRDPDLLDWLAFRQDSLTACYAEIQEATRSAGKRSFRLAAGPRSAAFAPLCGYDLARLATILDVLLPKHYFWHRGFDGLYGTVARYVETLVSWNVDLSEAAALEVVGALFGLDLPEITSLADFDNGFPPAFFEQIVTRETARVLAAVDDPERVVPWVDAGRRPHDGDPLGAGDLGRILDAAASAGLRRFIYHHHGNLTPGDWAVISRRGGTGWQTAAAPPLTPDLEPNTGAMPGYYPPDLSDL